MKSRKLVKYGLIVLLFLLISGLIEVVLFNIRSLQSFFYNERDFSEYNVTITGVLPTESESVYSIQDNYATVVISGLDTSIKNLKLDIETVDSVASINERTGVCDVRIVPESQAMDDNYFVVDHVVADGNPESQYVWFYTQGDETEISIMVYMESGSQFRLNDIKFNAKRPIMFSWARYCIILFVLVAIYLFRQKSFLWKEDCITWSRWKKVTMICIIFGVTIGAFELSANNPAVGKWFYYEPYQELARAFDAGQVSLLEQPSQQVLSIENPYQYGVLKAEGLDPSKGDYKQDFVLYQGKYYVYFGVVPCLLFYYPCYHFTGLNMPTSLVIVFEIMLFAIGFFFLLRSLVIQYYPKTSFAMFLLMYLATIMGCQLPVFASQPDCYIVPIFTGAVFTIWGIYFWISSRKKKTIDYGRIFLGSLCMAFVAGCRPTMVLYSFLVIPLLGDYFILRFKDNRRKALSDVFCLIAPYIIVAIPIMYYNYVRFGAVSDFGVKYTLTVQNINSMHFCIDNLFVGISEYLFRLPKFNYQFPYIQMDDFFWNAIGHRGICFQVMVGGLFCYNLFLLSIFAIFKLKKKWISKKLFCTSIMILFFTIILIGVSSILTNSIMYRYLMEFSFALFIVAWIVIMAMRDCLEGKEYKSFFQSAFSIMVFASFWGNAMLIFIPGFTAPLFSGNTDLYYKIFYGFNFW